MLCGCAWGWGWGGLLASRRKHPNGTPFQVAMVKRTCPSLTPPPHPVTCKEQTHICAIVDQGVAVINDQKVRITGSHLRLPGRQHIAWLV
eukprot:2617734-Amphidinium_carterae.1